MEHTPGPWEVHEQQHVDGEFWCSIGRCGWGPITDIVGGEGNKTQFFQPVAGMRHLVTPVEEQKANARLIAAAPELLEVVEELVESAKNHRIPLTGRARAVVAKVKGG